MTWEILESTCAACQKCALGATRTKSVFGTGSRTADLLFVGEAPGDNEDKTGIPFVGRAGQLLDKFLAAVDLDRKKNIYIANIVKCRPPQNRDPLLSPLSSRQHRHPDENNLPNGHWHSLGQQSR